MNTPNDTAASPTQETAAPTAVDPPSVRQLKRIFRRGSLDLPDLAPQLEASASLKLYEPSRPMLKSATLGPCYEEDGLLVYPIQKLPVETKGAQ